MKHKKVLLDTGDDILVEFSRSSKSYWGGKLVPKDPGKFCIEGSNKMGGYMMEIRRYYKLK
jgi:predicted NAD-dependent protein-ADP-ribosyltransferase YbiA (DUF1768 family)